jgi:hypothetical protein
MRRPTLAFAALALTALAPLGACSSSTTSPPPSSVLTGGTGTTGTSLDLCSQGVRPQGGVTVEGADTVPADASTLPPRPGGTGITGNTNVVNPCADTGATEDNRPPAAAGGPGGAMDDTTTGSGATSGSDMGDTGSGGSSQGPGGSSSGADTPPTSGASGGNDPTPGQ